MSQRKTDSIKSILNDAAVLARKETDHLPDADKNRRIKWPIACTIGPGMEGAIACETRVGFVNGAKGQLVYSGYDIFDLCARSTFEEVSFLLLHERLPARKELDRFTRTMKQYRSLPYTIRRLMSVPVEDMNPMAALRMGTNFMRQRLTWRDSRQADPTQGALAADEDSIPMETPPKGEKHAIYEFKTNPQARPAGVRPTMDDATSLATCIHLISGLATLAAAIARIRNDQLPIDPDPELSHAANFLYMLTGCRPSAEEAHAMDIALILHADHGMNASTFASMVVASTLSDIYFSIGAGIAALNGPLHGGANREAVTMLETIGEPARVDKWLKAQIRAGKKIPGFGHRVYKVYDPRARALAPLVARLARNDRDLQRLYNTAQTLEKQVARTLGKEKNIFPNVDFYSGLLYRSMGIPSDMFPCIFAVSRVSGWTARVLEYLRNNRIFRPRAWYVGDLDKRYAPIHKR